MKTEIPQDIIENLTAAIENMIDAKINLSKVKTGLAEHGLYQARADIKESLALLLDVELK